MRDYYNYINEEEEEKLYLNGVEDEICKKLVKCKTLVEKYKIRYESTPDKPMIVAKPNLLPKPFNGVPHPKYPDPWLTVSFKEFTELAMAFAYVLRNTYKIQPQTRIAILTNSLPINQLLVVALWFIRAVAVEVPSTLGDDIKQCWVKILDMSMLFYDATFKPKNVNPEILKKEEMRWPWIHPLNEDEHDLVSGEEGIRSINIDNEKIVNEILEAKAKGLFLMEKEEEDDVIVILGTSSSTQAIIKNGQCTTMKFVPYKATYKEMIYNPLFNTDNQIKKEILLVPPFYHGLGMICCLVRPQQTGQPIIYRTQNVESLGIIPEMLLDDLTELNVHNAIIFPYILAEFKKLQDQNHPRWPIWEKMLKTRDNDGFKIAGSPPIPEINKWLYEEFNLLVSEEYGATELGATLYVNKTTRNPGEEGYMGKLFFCDIYLDPIDENEENIGEIFIKSRTDFTGYIRRLKKGEVPNPDHKMPGLRTDFMADECFKMIDGKKMYRTNDIFRRSPITGNYKYISRADDIITFSTGIKMNPIPFEKTMQLSCKNIKICTLILDSTKTEVICFIEPEWKFIKDEEGKFIDITRKAEDLDESEIKKLSKLAQSQIWESIYGILHEESGSLANWAKQLTKENIFIIEYGEVYPVTAKGSPSKRIVRVKYSEILDNITKVIKGEISIDDVYNSEKKKDEDENDKENNDNKNDDEKDKNKNITENSNNSINNNNNNNSVVADEISNVNEMIMLIYQSLKEHNSVLLEFKDFNPELSFKQYGIDSLSIIKFAKTLSRKLNKTYLPSVLYNYGTPSLLAKYLVKKEKSADENVEAIPCSLNCFNNSRKIAIIGMAVRLPNAIDDEKKLWASLIKGKDCVLPLPKNRKLHIGYVNKPSNELEKDEHNVPRCGYYDTRPNVAKHTQFDASFFNCTPDEATGLDVKHRWILETSWEALENAGIAPNSLEDSNTGVFVGVGDGQELNSLVEENGLSNAIGSHNSSPCAIAGRLSYYYKLYGPSMTVDTACSTGATALHSACTSMAYGECDLSIVTAASFMYNGSNFVKTSKARMTSPRGRCATFDAEADGFATSEGCVTYILKRLEDAERDKDNILGVILGTSTGQSGVRQSISTPSSEGQSRNLLRVLRMANVKPSQISYVEAHGTGTPFGDALEVHGLNQVYKNSHSKENPLIVGSIKSNIGHTCEVAGLAGIAKVLVAMKHKTIPKNIHFNKLNPEIDLEAIPMTIPVHNMPWNVQNENEPRIAQVSSYGLQGSIVTIILQEYINKDKKAVEDEIKKENEIEKVPTMQNKHILIVSAKNKIALLKLYNKYMQILEDMDDDESVADLCYSTNLGRQHFEYRITAVGENADELSRDLQEQHDKFLEKDTLLSNIKDSNELKLIENTFAKRRMNKNILMVCGENQYENIPDEVYKSAAYLFRTQPVFMKAIDTCNKIIIDITNYKVVLINTLLTIGEPKPENLEKIKSCKKEINNNAYVNQFITLSLHYASYKLLCSLNKEVQQQQTVLFGYKFGELVAAVLSGKVSLTHAFSLIQHLSRWSKLETEPSDEEISQIIRNWINEPENTENYTIQEINKNAIKEKTLYSCNEKAVYLVNEKLPTNYWISLIRKLTNKSGNAENDNEGFNEECQKILSDYEIKLSFVINMSINKSIEENLIQCIQRVNVNSSKNDLTLIPQSSLYKNFNMNENIYECIRGLFMENIEINWNKFHKRVIYGTRKEYNLEKITLPLYPFQRSRFWPVDN